MNFSSTLIEEAVMAFTALPGIGKKTALRLVLHLIDQPGQTSEQFSEAIVKMRRNIKHCSICHNVSDAEICAICTSPKRNSQIVCIVETIRDVMAIEATGQFNGVYHVLGGVISPIEGVGPDDLNIESLEKRVHDKKVKEVIMAISPTIEGDTTIFYISKKIKDSGVNISTIARGISFGGELEYADELTLGRSIATRLPYQDTDK